jgi:phage gpG-like protein
MPLGILYSVTGEDDVRHMLLAIGDRAEDARPAFKVIADQLRAVELALFEAEGAGEWPPLKESTRERKAALGQPDKILQATGALKDSLTINNAEGATEYLSPWELVFGTHLTTEDGAPYPVFHQRGTSKMPARPPIIVDEVAMRIASKTIQAWLMAENRANFGVGPWGLTSLDPFGLAGQT